MALRQRMGDLGGREAEADDKRQVEQQLKRRCDTVSLVGITPAHRRGDGGAFRIWLAEQSWTIFH